MGYKLNKKEMTLNRIGVSTKSIVILHLLVDSTPYQYCQFNQVQRIKHLLTTNPRLPAAKELKFLDNQLTQSSRIDFAKSLEK